MLKIRAIVACDRGGCGAEYETEVTLDGDGNWTRIAQAPEGWVNDKCPRHSDVADAWTDVPTRNDGPPSPR